MRFIGCIIICLMFITATAIGKLIKNDSVTFLERKRNEKN